MEDAMGGMCTTLRNNENTFSTLIGKPERKKERNYLENLDADENIISKPVL
jgi:hypothetical protein